MIGYTQVTGGVHEGDDGNGSASDVTTRTDSIESVDCNINGWPTAKMPKA